MNKTFKYNIYANSDGKNFWNAFLKIDNFSFKNIDEIVVSFNFTSKSQMNRLFNLIYKYKNGEIKKIHFDDDFEANFRNLLYAKDELSRLSFFFIFDILLIKKKDITKDYEFNSYDTNAPAYCNFQTNSIVEPTNSLISESNETISGQANIESYSEEQINSIICSEQLLEKVSNGDIKIGPELLYASKLASLRVKVDELELIINNKETNENDIQKWFNANSKIFDSIFPINDENRNIGTTKKIDLWFISTFSPFREIIELKNPNKDIFRLDKDRNILYFSTESSKAISQLDSYITNANFNGCKGLENNKEIVLKNTNGVIFIGKKHNEWTKEYDDKIRSINSNLLNIKIYTYSHLLEFLKNYLNGNDSK